MKKKNKQIIAALAMVLIFGFSSIAFVAGSLTGVTQNSGAAQLTSFVIDGEVDAATQAAYMEAGYTFLKYYGAGSDVLAENFINSLPSRLSTSDGQAQLFVINVQGDTQSVQIQSFSGFETANATDQNSVIESLCRLLTVTPIECSLRTLNETA